MDKQYYKTIIDLNEAAKAMIKSNGSDPNIDSGKDIVDNSDKKSPGAAWAGTDMKKQVDNSNAKNQDLEDADYLDTLEMSPEEETIEVPEKQKLKKLFDLFSDLLHYGESLFDSLDNSIDQNLLDDSQVADINSLKNIVLRFNEKIKDYLNNVFLTEEYDRVLYTYILLRTELVAVIKSLNIKLGLNKKIDDEDINKDDSDKK